MPTEETTILPSMKLLESLVSKGRSSKNRAGTILGEFRSALAEAVEKHKLHKKAFAVARTVEGMEEIDRRRFWEHLDDYREKLKLDVYAQVDVEDVTGGKPHPDSDGGKGPWPDDKPRDGDPTGTGKRAPASVN